MFYNIINILQFNMSFALRRFITQHLQKSYGSQQALEFAENVIEHVNGKALKLPAEYRPSYHLAVEGRYLDIYKGESTNLLRADAAFDSLYINVMATKIVEGKPNLPNLCEKAVNEKLQALATNPSGVYSVLFMQNHARKLIQDGFSSVFVNALKYEYAELIEKFGTGILRIPTLPEASYTVRF